METHYWRVASRPEWILSIGLVEFEGKPTSTPWLYVKHAPTNNVLLLAQFVDEDRADAAVTFISSMHEEINRAVDHHAKRGGDVAINGSAGSDERPANEPRRSSQSERADAEADPGPGAVPGQELGGPQADHLPGSTDNGGEQHTEPPQ